MVKKCVKCKGKLNAFKVEVEDADLPTMGYECAKCGELFFNGEKSRLLVENLKKKEAALKNPPEFGLQRKIIKLSKDRLGIYLSKDLTRSTAFKAGQEIELKIGRASCRERVYVLV